MLNFFKSNKTKKAIVKFFQNYENVIDISEKPIGFLTIKFSTISKSDLIRASNKLVANFESNIIDLEIVFNDNSYLQITNSIIVGLNTKLPYRSNLHLTTTEYENFMEYRTSQKYGKTSKDEFGNLVFATNIGTYFILKLNGFDSTRN